MSINQLVEVECEFENYLKAINFLKEKSLSLEEQGYTIGGAEIQKETKHPFKSENESVSYIVHIYGRLSNWGKVN